MKRPGRALFGVAAMLILIAGCGGDEPGDPGASEGTTAPSTTTAVTAATTTSTLPATVEITTDGLLKWQPGVTYTTGAFWRPITFSVDEPGWWSQGAAEIWINLEYHEGGESTFDLDLTVLAHDPARAPQDAVDAILGDETAQVVAGPTSTAVAGHPAITADLVVEESPLFGGTCGVNSAPGNSRFPTNDSGIYLLTEVGGVAQGPYGNAFGIRSCRAARIWAIDVDGATVLVIAATTTPEEFDGLIAHAVALIAGISFDDA